LPRAREGGWYINERVFISMTGYEYNGTKIGRSEPYTYFRNRNKLRFGQKCPKVTSVRRVWLC
jgi:hypothetical protein